ncbi:iron uptake porin [Limnothrix redekei]|uniref:Iron uptake porin n=1 Tax=Limnothrix redekei LRLZ20PSL1 TaxID=3112953 RepID=A0ABW7CB02_9CYAN
MKPSLFTALGLLSLTTICAPSPAFSAELSPMEQVTSVSQLSDVQPTDWAFQALQSLVERYGCIAGYPDGTFKGNRPLSRYEFAAGLNACLDRMRELISTATDDLAQKSDLAKLQKLQEEFATELATLRSRVNTLEARASELEANQFSTTTKLTGEAIMSVASNLSDDEDLDNQTVFQQRVRLNFNTSFTGKDLLLTRLQVGNATPFNLTRQNQDTDFATSTSEGVQAAQVFGDTGNRVVLDTLQYRFPLGDQVRVVLSANAGVWDDLVPTVNPYFEDYDGGNGSLSAFAQRNPIYRLGGGAGIGLSFTPSRFWELSLGYLAASASSPEDGQGLFNGDYSALAQVTWRPSEQFNLALTYNHAYFTTGRFGFDNGGGSIDAQNLPFTGTALANRLGATNAISSDSLGLSWAWKASPKFQLNGWLSYTSADLIQDDKTGELWSGALLLGFPDLFKEGNFGGFVVGFEPYLTDLDDLNDEFSQDLPLHFELFYKAQVTDNISITPGLIWLTAPNQDANNSDQVIGVLRTTFVF